jgi:hypothetical protein
VPGAQVQIDRLPWSGQLLAWGRAEDGWWGLFAWWVRLQLPAAGGRVQLFCSAWVPAASLSQPAWGRSAEDLPRLPLPADRDRWPPPAASEGWHAGIWVDGPMPVPAAPPRSMDPRGDLSSGDLSGWGPALRSRPPARRAPVFQFMTGLDANWHFSFPRGATRRRARDTWR